MQAPAQRTTTNQAWQGWGDPGAYGLTILLLVGVPVAFSTAVYRMYSLPKFALLLTGAAALAPLLVWRAMLVSSTERRLLASRQVLLVALFSVVLTITTIFGATPVAALFGSSYNQMGLVTHLCFFILFVALIVVNGTSERRFRITLWAMTLTGLAVATYAVMQFFGRDPFLQPQSYTFESPGGTILRVNSTLGHSNYLGNFLLYVTPLSVGLALASRGRAQRVGSMAAGLSAIAIVLSGTRGAWLGLVVATLSFRLLNRSRGAVRLLGPAQRGRINRWAVGALVGFAILLAIVAMNPASRGIVQRGLSLVKDPSGSGRTLLWRDAVRMIPEYPIVGCGPEGFRTAFLPYKSIDLARLAPETNNESSHNSYVDAAISYGLPGAVLYIAIIASSISLLIGARRRAKSDSARMICVSLTASLAGVVVHNFFIFDQISTGLYFFAFAALAQISTNIAPSGVIASGEAPTRTRFRRTEDAEGAGLRSSTVARRAAPFLLLAGLAIAFAGAWHAFAIMRAEIQISKAIASAAGGDLDGVVEHGNRSIESWDLTGEYSLLFARTLALWADNAATSSAARGSTQPDPRVAANRTLALRLAASHAEESLKRAPADAGACLLLAYLSLRLGDSEKLYEYASEAIKRDANFSNSHWLLSEAHLARSEPELAHREATLALSLNPNSRGALSVLKRIKGAPTPGSVAEELVRYGRALAKAGNFERARRVLLRAQRRSGGRCPECHSALASLYETAQRYPEAIAEWQAYAVAAPESAAAEGIDSRIERLKESAAKQK